VLSVVGLGYYESEKVRLPTEGWTEEAGNVYNYSIAGGIVGRIRWEDEGR
jgi:hypothetical protein